MIARSAIPACAAALGLILASGPLLAQSSPSPQPAPTGNAPLSLLPGSPAPQAAPPDGRASRDDSNASSPAMQMSMAAAPASSSPGAPLPEMQIDKRPGDNGPGTKE